MNSKPQTPTQNQRTQTPKNDLNVQWPTNSICNLFQTTHPIVQAGMVYVSGAKLAAAASETGCLGLIGAGSMSLDLLRSQIQKCKTLTKRSFGVNLPLLYEKIEEQIDICLEEGVRIFFTSAGSPNKWTKYLKEHQSTVVHVASSPYLAQKCQDAGVDAVVLEGFEAGGHNGREELTTLVLLQQVYQKLQIPVIAAGGIGSGAAIHACFALGAQGVQIGSLFAATVESSAHRNFKQKLCESSHNSTFLRMKKLIPVRLLNNAFSEIIAKAEDEGASSEELKSLLGKGRAKQGILLGDLENGELEIGQIVSEIKEIRSCPQLVHQLCQEYLMSF